MANWTAECSKVLSALLDEVVGTPDVVDIRQDDCRISDCIGSIWKKSNTYYTGSKAEGLDLPGSDDDFMTDSNDWLCSYLPVKVIQSLDEIPSVSPYNIFLFSTENVHPCFALLQHVNQNPNSLMLPLEYLSMNGLYYLSSDLVMEDYLSHIEMRDRTYTLIRQGPSVETWSEYCKKSESGLDDVLSIHCDFWPNTAQEWTQRSRHFGWPTSHDISSIINFGCHLVPVGHPLSDTKFIEWRISFSVAERTLVWSFNHVQIQCYAVMKIILKEFIKVKSSPKNQVLCSYFIKTFLFWKYETNDLNFWRADNFRECMLYLLTEFSQCLHEGVLRHYFIPNFNLLSVKLTQNAQTELLALYDIILQSDISILRECRTLQNIWSDFIHFSENKNKVLRDITRKNMLQNDECMIISISEHFNPITDASQLPSLYDIIGRLLSLPCKTQLKTFVIKLYLFCIHTRSLIQFDSRNKKNYQMHRTVQSKAFSVDILSNKLWYATLLWTKRDYSSILNITNEILSSVPPFALYCHECTSILSKNVTKQLYIDTFLESGITMTQRAKKAWLFDLDFTKDMTDVVPLAIQIELYFGDPDGIRLSPLTYAYYLQFLCYHRIGQYRRSKTVLQKFIDLMANNQQYASKPHYHLNIAGHCHLLAGERAQAWQMFSTSYHLTQRHPPYDKYNSAQWYLQNCFSSPFSSNQSRVKAIFVV